MLKIRDLRKVNNMTQTELAAKLKIAKSTLSQYENGKRNPSIRMLRDISAVFSVSIDELIREEL